MSMEKGLLAGLFDFSFHESLAPRLIRLLYVIALLAGGIAVVAVVVTGMQQSPAQGLLALVAGLVAYFVGVLYVRLVLEVLTAILRIAANIERLAGGSGA